MNKAKKIIEENLKNQTVVLATSGGPDSMALLYLTNKLKEKLNIKIICAHVNHKLRKESDDEEIMVKDFCKENNLIFELLTINNYNKDNFHNDARIKRYDFFEECVKKYQAKYLLTAHHGDDLIETILMRIVRGSSLKGYSGFSKITLKENYKILRPLINYTKDEILKYVKDNKIPYAIDKSNEKDIYTRNRYRKYIIPPLKKEDKNVHDKFYKFSQKIEMYNNYIEKETNKHLKEVYTENTLYIKPFKKLDIAIQNRIIEKILQNHYQENLNIITEKHINLIYEILINKKPNQVINLPLNNVGIKAYDIFQIKKEKNQKDYKFEFSKDLILPNNDIIRISDSTKNSNNICRLNSKKIKYPLYIRNKREGDKIQIKGLNGRKKVKDIFIDSKITKEERNYWPLLVDSNDNILWVPGIKKSKFDIPKDQNYDIILEYFKGGKD